jgi:hypothetical protein
MIQLMDEASEEKYIEPGHGYYILRKRHEYITLSFTTSRTSMLI